MKKVLAMIIACFPLVAGNVLAQNTRASEDSASHESQNIDISKQGNVDKNAESTPKKRISKPTSKSERSNDPTFRDDSSDASVGMSGLSTTPGVSTTSGAGGLGTNENTGENTSSDIYNIERKDSIKEANENKRQHHGKKSKRGPTH